jgi:hypothetical protein
MCLSSTRSFTGITCFEFAVALNLLTARSCTCTSLAWFAHEVHMRLLNDVVDLLEVRVLAFWLANALLIVAQLATHCAAGFTHPILKR